MNKLVAVACALFCALHGVGSAETEHPVDGMSVDRQRSLGHGRKMSAVTADELSAVVSGSEVANRGTCASPDRLEPGYERDGEEIDAGTSQNAAACAEFCGRRVAGCVAINFYEDDDEFNCVYLSSVDYIRKTEGCTTAMIDPTPENVCWPRNFIFGQSRPGYKLRGSPFYRDSAVECCKLCYGTRRCIAFDYDVEQGQCWLKYGVAPFEAMAYIVTGVICFK